MISTRTEVDSPKILENWKVWISIVIVLCLIAWGPVIVQGFDTVNGFNSAPYTPSGAPLP